MLRTALEDLRLSRSERRALKQVFEELDLDEAERREIRNRAFRLAEAQLEGPGARLVIDWLHDVVKALDAVAISARPAPIEEAFFSPGSECSRRIVRLLKEARSTLDVCVFTITDNSSALLAAHERGVVVRVVTDDAKADDRGSDAERLERAGVRVRFDRSEAHMHHKYAIADGRLLLTGSYNWTVSARTENDENILVTGSPALVGRFAGNFESLWRRLG